MISNIKIHYPKVDKQKRVGKDDPRVVTIGGPYWTKKNIKRLVDISLTHIGQGFYTYIPLNATREIVLMQVED